MAQDLIDQQQAVGRIAGVDVAADESDGDTEHFGMEVEREGVESHAHCVIRSGSRR